MSAFFTAGATDGHARTGTLTFERNRSTFSVDTPAFMPVGTRATVKGLRQEDLEEIGYRLILANTYHLFLRPGGIVADLGGLHKFMSWPGALLTDSGGFQVFSLSDRVKFQENGVEFRSHIDGSRHLFTPESVIDFQLGLGSDIMMVLDDCPPGDADRTRIQESLARTHRWADRAASYFDEHAAKGRLDTSKSRLFGIVQGGISEEDRLLSLSHIQSLPFAGIAVGGLSVGEAFEDYARILALFAGRLDPARPRYVMGIGTVDYILEAVRSGFDIFDCVLPTRNARHGQLFTTQGRLLIRNSIHAKDPGPIDPECSCRVCARYSRAYLRHLFTAGEMLGPVLATHHNLHFFFVFMNQLRTAIERAEFDVFYRRWIGLSL
ncbi:MAG: tRNA guanosine(34) transglycosylase Tgt [Spirochaetia bacterium]|nr:tRNA guanosine(34) transglycosylase Tgt [Spirochaetia bacterium]